MPRWLEGLEHRLAAERGRLLPWVPVAMGLGVLAWLEWPGDPSGGVLVTAAGLAGAGALAWGLARQALLAGLGVMVLGLAAGFLAIAWRSSDVAAPVLSHRWHGPIEGRIIHVDRGSGDRMRLTLDEVAMGGHPPDATPLRVRVTLAGPQPWLSADPGTRVMMTAHLAPPQGAVEPGGFDFRRHAWFRGLGAVGQVRTPVLVVRPPQGMDAWIARLRMHLSGAIQARIPAEPGALAAAMLTGDRSGMGQGAVLSLRDSNLYHLVSISGVHMSLLAGFVLLSARWLLGLVPVRAVQLAARKLAAGGALAVSAFYLLLSGGDVATERAFVMVAVMLGAIMLDRRAISLRSVALAAMVILIRQPEAVVEPGFQMSFAATTGLVLAFDWLRGLKRFAGWPGWVRAATGLFLSSLVAGLASAPFAAAHFNRVAEHGLLANLLVGPAMGILVMPGGVMAAAMAPIGLAWPGLWMLDLGCRWILRVADLVAGLDDAVRPVASPPAGVLVMLGLGSCLLANLRGWARLSGVLVLGATLLVWNASVRPWLLVSADGRLLGWMGEGGRVLSSPRGNGFAAAAWLVADGDMSDRRAGLDRGPPLPDEVVHLLDPALARALCRPGGLLISPLVLDLPDPACQLVDGAMLSRLGAMAIDHGADGGWHLRGVDDGAPRPWTRHRGPDQ